MENHKSVCIIDDDPIHVFLVKKIIEMNRLSSSVIDYNCASQAYKELVQKINNNEKLPDIILLDINMPEWDGWHFLKEFKKKVTNQKPKIFVTTSSDNPVDIERANTHTCVEGFIVKPITKEKLNDIINY